MPGSLTLDPAEMVIVEPGDEFDALLADPAGEVTTLLPDYDPADEAEDLDEAKQDGWLARIILEEGVAGYLQKKFDESKHPRWPKDTPKAGEFMRVGDVFRTKDGKQWQVIHASGLGMKIVATDFSGKTAEQVHLHATSAAAPGKGVAVPDIEAPVAKAFDRNTSPVVSPYVEPDTHDPSLALPAGSKLSAEAWKRFGRDDQEYYIEVMHRFGEWTPSTAKSMMAQTFGQYSHEVQSAVSKAYQGNKSGSGFWHSGAGQWLNLAFLFKSGDAASSFAKYQEIKDAYDELSEIVHWDLYNRSKSPDITLFHGGGGDGQGVTKYQNDYIGGKVPIYAGFSQSYSLSGATSWGSTVLMTPTAIRHIAMSYYTPLPSGSSHWGEKEIAVGVRMKLDDRSVTFDSSSFGVSSGSSASQAINKWLLGMTASQPASGSIVQELKDVWAGKGNIPIPPEPPGITPVSATGQGYVELSPALATKAGEMAHALKYKSDDGSKEAAIGKIDGMGLKPGDFIEGKQGTRYVIIADAGDPNSGLRYVKIEPGTKMPNYGKSFPFSASAGNDFYRLDGHIDIPKVKEAGFTPFSEEQYSKLVPGQKTNMNDLGLGAMFKVDGEGYKVTGAGPGGKIALESLDTGKKFTGNGLYPAIPLIPGEGYVPPAPTFDQPDVEPGDAVLLTTKNGYQLYGHVLEVKEAEPGKPAQVKVQTPAHPEGVWELPEKLSEPPQMPGESVYEIGDKFQHGGVGPYTITSILKSGTVRAKLSGGKVHPFEPADLKQVTVYRPSTFAPGNKAKVGDLDIGDVVQSGAGAKVRPYVITGKFGNKVFLNNLETGDTLAVTKNKTYVRLLDKKAIDATAAPGPGEKPLNPELVNKLVPGAAKGLDQMEVGDAFAQDTGNVWVVKETGASGVHAQLYQNGSTVGQPEWFSKAAYGDYGFPMLVPPTDEQKAAKPELNSKFDASKYHHGDESTLSDLDEGSLFLSATGIPMMLKSKAPKGGATAIAMHNGKTVKNIPKDKPFTTLVEKDEVPPELAPLEKGDPVKLGELKADDVFHLDDGSKWVVVAPADADQYMLAHPYGGGPAKPLAPTDAMATYMGTKDDQPAPVAPVDIHADELPKPPIYVNYMHAKSGKNHYPLVSSMAVGTVFTDKTGHTFKVKQTGGQAVVTESGSGALYSVEDHWRGKLAPDAAFLDDVSLPEAPSHQDGKPTLGDLHVGDKFVIPYGYAGSGKEYEVVDTTQTEHGDPSTGLESYTTIKATHTASYAGGIVEDFATSMKPSQITPAGKQSGITPTDPGQAEALTAKSAAKSKVKHPFFSLGQPTTKDEMPTFGFAMTSTGKLLYKGNKDKLFELGSEKEFGGKITGLVALRWSGPEAESKDDLEPAGEPKSLHLLVPGDFFIAQNDNAFQVLAVGKDGITGKHVDPAHPYVAFTNKTMMTMQPAKLKGSLQPSEIAVKPSKEFMLGDEAWTLGGQHGVFKMASDQSKGFYIDGDPVPHYALDLYASDPLQTKGEPAAAHPKAASDFPLMGNLPLGAIIHTPSGALKVSSFHNGSMTFDVLDGEHAGQTTTVGQAKPTPDSWRVESGSLEAPKVVEPEPEPEPEPETPDGFLAGQWTPAYDLTALPPEMKPNDESVMVKDLPLGSYYAYKHDYGEGFAMMKIVTAGPDPETDSGGQGLGVGKPMPTYVPDYVWTPESAAEPEESLPFADVGVGERFEAHGAVWEKLPGGEAKILSVIPGSQQMAEPGYIEKGLKPTDTVIWKSSAPKPTASSAPGDGEVQYQQVKDGGTFTYGGNTYLKLGHGSLSGWAQKVTGVDAGEKKSFALQSMVQTAPEHVADGGNPLEPYLHGKSGKYKYVHLHTLAPKTEFTDKKGGKYKVIGHVGGFTQFLDGETGKTHSAPSSYRVKVTKTPGEGLVEGRALMRGDGRVLLGV